MRSSVLGFLAFLCCLKGLTCTQWTMRVQSQVNSSLGQNVIIPCPFTHPRQKEYKGIIVVRWMQENKIKPIFYCSLHNTTSKHDGNCTEKSGRLSLYGDPRKGDISLRINNLQFSDSSKYTCRVELDYDKFGNHTELHVNAPAEILLLSLDVKDKSDALIVKCIAQGNPVPELKLSSSSGQLINEVKNVLPNFVVMSAVQFSEQDLYTCQAENALGRAHRTFPDQQPDSAKLLIVIAFLGALLLLVIVAFVLFVIRGQSALTVIPRQIGAQRVEASIYHTNEIVYANVSPVGCESGQAEVCSPEESTEDQKMGPNSSMQRLIYEK